MIGFSFSYRILNHLKKFLWWTYFITKALSFLHQSHRFHNKYLCGPSCFENSGSLSVHGKTTYQWYTDDIRVHTSDIRMTYEYIRLTCKWHANNIRNIKSYKGLELLDRNFQNSLWLKHCFRRLQMIFGYYSDSHTFY